MTPASLYLLLCAPTAALTMLAVTRLTRRLDRMQRLSVVVLTAMLLGFLSGITMLSVDRHIRALERQAIECPCAKDVYSGGTNP